MITPLEKQLRNELNNCRGFKKTLLQVFWTDGKKFSHPMSEIKSLLEYRDRNYQQKLSEAIAKLEVAALKG